MGYFAVDCMADMSLIEMASHQCLNLKQGECLLLCSDGFSEVLDGRFLPMGDGSSLKAWLNGSISQIKEIKSMQELDNISAVLVQRIK